MLKPLHLPETPAAKRLRELIAAISTATPSSVADYVNQNYVPAYAERDPIGRRIGHFMDWKARGGMTVIDVTHSEPLRIETLVKQALSDEHWTFGVHVEETPPHRIEAVMLGRADLPILESGLADQEAADAFIGYCARLADADLFSGAVLIARHGRILGHEAYGLANRDFGVSNTIDTRFNVASLCKSWTAVAIAQLVEAGALSFDDSLAKFIAYPDSEAASCIRIKHLLSHTSGLGSYFTEEFNRTARHLIRTVDDYLALSKDQQPSFKPGETWKYSNTGMVVLGKVIEIVTGQTYFEYVTQNIIERADMEQAAFLELDYANENVAVGYGKKWTVDGLRYANSLYENCVGACPAGCGFATVHDIFRFAEALKDGTLISKDMVQCLTNAKIELNAPDYGYGFSIHPERALYGHSGGLLGASSNLDIVEAPPGWVVVVLANDLSMRAPVLKSRQLIGVNIPETSKSRSYLPNAGVTAR